MLWEIVIHCADGQRDLIGEAAACDAAEVLGADSVAVGFASGYLIQGEIDKSQAELVCRKLLVDSVTETAVFGAVHDSRLDKHPDSKLRDAKTIYVLPKAGVTDTVGENARNAMVDFGITAELVRAFRKYWIVGVDDVGLETLCSKLLSNDAIEQAIIGSLPFDRLQLGSPYTFKLITVPIRSMNDDSLVKLSRDGQLYLSLTEMQTIKSHFVKLDRDPTDIELETVAQTWSEHCSHKTLAGRIRYKDPSGERVFTNMLKETIFAATVKIRETLGDADRCVSVFSDNAGVVKFDEKYNVCFKVETHNHPSALEPYGGANTGLGGVIRDPMGTGMGAKPVCSTDVFCFAPPNTDANKVPAGVLHPRRIIRGVVSGVRDYGNRMGIPTVNGAVYFDERYLGNPLVFCGNVGIIPKELSFKNPQAGDLIVAIGGRTGRDGIHGATFSSAELTSESETLSGGAVQIGNAITEKMVLDVMLQARDKGLFTAVTDCGAGGFSSAVGEMGEHIGAEVELKNIPVKYEGLTYTETWISEAQERMVFSVPTEKWDEFRKLCESEDVEATVLGTFKPTERLVLRYNGTQVADLTMSFLHNGRPPIVRDAVYTPPEVTPLTNEQVAGSKTLSLSDSLFAILSSLNVASKHWIIRQYDHEVQGGSVLKPLVGANDDGPGDAAVVRPRIDSQRGLVLSCGMNPCYGDFDTYDMAASAIDEAIRNAVAVGADPQTIAILDNFCWGNTERPETLGSLVRAAIACYDVATVLGTPFVSGKDSLNNEFRNRETGQTIAIPPSLLISAMGQVDDVTKCVSMDFKQDGSIVYLVGETKEELGGSHYAKVNKLKGGQSPKVDAVKAKQIFISLHQAINDGCVIACHDLSEGGLAVSLAEMSFAGNKGVNVTLPKNGLDDTTQLFSESNTRFICEVNPSKAEQFEKAMQGLQYAKIGNVTNNQIMKVTHDGKTRMEVPIEKLKTTWLKPLDF
ncbi:MAG: phosphoribosylformylglycinamidine synthase subunit PurL [Planctomycetaceae bacterium]|jgi:phosphoribosylformylglycinamidine synthase|nr:phosphoribosylformylglycinamidine synthase subunit PurL [Planctomycetaceae bacterium]